MKVAIIGGGISGLAAAYEFEAHNRTSEARIDVHLIEASERLGGKVHTVHEDGYLLEAGPDSFVTTKTEVLKLASELGIEERLLPSNPQYSGSYVWSRGRLHRLPEGLLLMVPSRMLPFFLSPLLSWPGKLRMAMDLLIPPKKDDEEESLEQFVLRRLGREALERIAEPLVAGIHGAAPATMSVQASFPRFIQMEQQYGSLLRAAWNARKRSRQQSPARGHGTKPDKPYSFFMSFRNGMSELVEALGERIPSARIRTGLQVIGIQKEPKDGGYRLFYATGASEPFDGVILAVPAYVAADLLGDFLPRGAEILRQIRYASTANVQLAYPPDAFAKPLSGSGFVVPAVENRHIMGVTFSSRKWQGRAPNGKLLLRAFIGGRNQALLDGASTTDLIDIVQRELQEMLGVTGQPLLARAFVWRRSMPQYQLGHLERVKELQQLAAGQQGLALAGAAYQGIGLSDCIRTGREAARRILESLHGLAVQRSGES